MQLPRRGERGRTAKSAERPRGTGARGEDRGDGGIPPCGAGRTGGARCSGYCSRAEMSGQTQPGHLRKQSRQTTAGTILCGMAGKSSRPSRQIFVPGHLPLGPPPPATPPASATRTTHPHVTCRLRVRLPLRRGTGGGPCRRRVGCSAQDRSQPVAGLRPPPGRERKAGSGLPPHSACAQANVSYPAPGCALPKIRPPPAPPPQRT